MSLKITERSVGDVTILDCSGRNTLGEGAGLFRETIRDLVAKGRKKIILNYSQVTYQDSSGNGELVSAHYTVSNHGGSLIILNPSKRFKDLLQITKLYTVFEVFEDESSALRSLQGTALHCQCPVCGARSSPALIGAPPWEPQTCTRPGCEAIFTVAASNQNANQDVIQSLKLPTYPDEYLEVIAGTPMEIAVIGRLNLFTSKSVDKLWRALPSRIALLDLSRATEITPEGRGALLRIINALQKDEGIAVVTEGSASEIGNLLSPVPQVYATRAHALSALTRLAESTKPWPATLDLARSASP